MIKFMPDRDPMEELFRRNESRMEQRPSLRSWHKLEQRLDQRAGRRSRYSSSFSWIYMAAAIVLLCIVAIGIAPQLGQKQDVLAQRPESIEDLEQANKGLPVPTKYQHIPEGNSNHVLQVRNPNLPQLLPAPKYRI